MYGFYEINNFQKKKKIKIGNDEKASRANKIIVTIKIKYNF